jgi:hypothetical protein
MLLKPMRQLTAWEENTSFAGIYAMLTESYLNWETGFR